DGACRAHLPDGSRWAVRGCLPGTRPVARGRRRGGSHAYRKGRTAEMKLLVASLLTLAMPTVAQAEIIVSDPWARASILASRPGAAYLTLTSDEPDRLLELTSPIAEHVMLHRVETDAA